MFISSDNLARANFIEGTITEVARTLDTNPDVQKRLGKTASTLRDALGRLFIPDTRHGVIAASPAHKSGLGVPIVAMSPGDSFTVHPMLASMHPVQRDRTQAEIARLLNQKKTNSDVVATLEVIEEEMEKEEHIYEYNPSRVSGVVFGASIFHDVDSQVAINASKKRIRVFDGMPIVGLAMGEAIGQSVVTVVHELVHVMQREQTPVRPGGAGHFNNNRLRQELEAYGVGGDYGFALYCSDDPLYKGNPDVLGNRVVDNISRNNVIDQKDPYKPSRIIKMALQSAGLNLINID